MPNPSGPVVELGGRSRVLRLDMRALYRIEMETPDQTALHHSVRAASGSVRSLALLTWAALLHEQGGHTVTDIVEMEGFGPRNEALLNGLAAEVEGAFPPPKNEGKEEAADDS